MRLIHHATPSFLPHRSTETVIDTARNSSRVCPYQAPQHKISGLLFIPTSRLVRRYYDPRSSVTSSDAATLPNEAMANQRRCVCQQRPRHSLTSHQFAPQRSRWMRRDLRELRRVQCVIFGAVSCVNILSNLRRSQGEQSIRSTNKYFLPSVFFRSVSLFDHYNLRFSALQSWLQMARLFLALQVSLS